MDETTGMTAPFHRGKEESLADPREKQTLCIIPSEETDHSCTYSARGYDHPCHAQIILSVCCPFIALTYFFNEEVPVRFALSLRLCMT